MNCKQCEERLATGNFIQRALARQHARRCNNCRGLLELADRLRREMSADQRLTADQRQLWLRAIDAKPAIKVGQADSGPLAVPLRRMTILRLRPAWAAGAVAAAITIFALGWVAGRMSSGGPGGSVATHKGENTARPNGPAAAKTGGEPPTAPGRESANTLVVEVQPPGTFPSTIDPPSSAEDARAGLLALSRRLDELAMHAVLLEERQEVARLAELSRPARP